MVHRQQGSMLLVGAGMLIILTGFAMVAFDIGRIYVVRNELQNVADAAALAGANCLTRRSTAGSTTDCDPVMATSLNWARATAKAQQHLGQNDAVGSPISTTDAGHTIEVGYWNLSTRAPSGGSFSTGFSPVTVNDKPAVRVVVRKDNGVNGGPISLLTRGFGGAEAVPIQAEAVAVISNPGTSNVNTLIPQVINKCMFDKFWDSANNRPLLYTGTPADPVHISTAGQPWRLRIGSSYHYDSCESGQWTTFAQEHTSAQEVALLIQNGNSTPLNVDGTTWIKPGTVGRDYQELDAKYPTPLTSGRSWTAPPSTNGWDVTVVVVDEPQLNPTGGDFSARVVGFAGFHIDDIVSNGNGRCLAAFDRPGEICRTGFYIEGHFIPANTKAGSGIGPSFGTYTPPRIAY